MSPLQKQIEEDLKSLFNQDEFSKEITHFFGEEDEPLIVNFFEKSEIVLDSKGSEFEGAVSLVPSITLPKTYAKNITEYSVFNIFGEEYEVIMLDPTATIMRVYLGHRQ
jgi:hypothetical protein